MFNNVYLSYYGLIHGWLNDLGSWIIQQLIQAYHRYGVDSRFVDYKKGALDSQPQVIKFTSYLPMVGGSLQVLRLLVNRTVHHDIVEILLKVALSTKNQSNHLIHVVQTNIKQLCTDSCNILYKMKNKYVRYVSILF